MLAVRRSAVRAAQASRATLSRQSRRHAHDSHSGHAHDAHSGPKEEHFSVRLARTHPTAAARISLPPDTPPVAAETLIDMLFPPNGRPASTSRSG